MEKIALTVEVREGLGKGPARSIRRAGGFPAVIYGQGKSTPITINRREFARILNSGGGGTTLLSVKVAGTTEADKLAIVRDFQTDPLSRELLHADLLEVAMDKAIHVTAPVTLVAGEIKGVKAGGILQHPTREVNVECLPDRIPEHIFVDCTGLEIGGSMHISDLKLPDGVKVLDDPHKVVVSVAAPISDEKLDKMLSTEAASEVKEPEVLTKAKEEEEAK
jgi:large subunit ribosomal protein L25